MSENARHDPTYLGAAVEPLRRHSPLDDEPTNPYEQLRHDRIAYVREQVTNTFTSFYGPDDEDVFDQTDFIDAILDAHADWLATPQVTGDQVNAACKAQCRVKAMELAVQWTERTTAMTGQMLVAIARDIETYLRGEAR